MVAVFVLAYLARHPVIYGCSSFTDITRARSSLNATHMKHRNIKTLLDAFQEIRGSYIARIVIGKYLV